MVLENLRKSILAGALIGFGGTLYLSVDSTVVGSLLFSFGLIAILVKGFNLYTGKVGYTEKKSDILPLLLTLVGNLIGITVVAVIYRVCGANLTRVETLCQAKLAKEWWQVLLLAFMCGVLMYLAVSLFRKTKNPLLVMMPISFFILSGFEHCVATFFFLVAGLGWGFFDWKVILYVVLMIIGNGVGSIVWRLIEPKSVKAEN